jgi:Ran GTPase-activating protein (RanGAP) involved in mRNA processing and transport
MTSPIDADLDRRDFLSLGAILAGGVLLKDLLRAPETTGVTAESLRLQFDMNAWLTKAMLAGENPWAAEPENPYSAFLDQAEAVFKTSPQIRSLTFDNSSGRTLGIRLDARQFAACPQLAQLHTLIFLGSFLEPEDIRIIGASRYLSNLQRLVIWMDDIGDDGVRALAVAPMMSNLRMLSLNANRIGPAGAKALASSPRLGRLESFDLYFNSIGNEGVRAIAESQSLPSLKRLCLSENEIDREGAQALAAAPRLPRLVTLGLAHQMLGPEGIKILTTRFGGAVWVEDDRATPEASEEAWRKKVLAENPNDATRLAHSEWLGKSDPRRAEFIRPQIATASRPEYEGIGREEKNLCNNMIAAYGPTWLLGIELLAPTTRGRDRDESFEWFMHHMRDSRAVFSLKRGLVEHVALNSRGFLKNADRVWHEAPWLTAAQINCGVDPAIWDRQLASSPLLARLTELELRNVSPEVLRGLAGSPHVSRLNTLRLTGDEFDAEILATLLSPKRLPQLLHLALSGCSNEVLARLAATGHLARLASLRVSGSEIEPSTVSNLFQPSWPGLRSLDFTDSYLGDAGGRALAQSAQLAGLQSLNLAGVGLQEDAIQELARSPHLAGLEALTLQRNEIGPGGAGALAASSQLSRLRLLNLAKAEIDSEGAAALAASPHLSELRTIDLGGNDIGDAGVIAFARAASLRQLEILELNSTGMTTAGAESIARSGAIASVVALDVSSNTLGDLGLQALAASTHLRKLRVLEVAATEDQGNGAVALANTRNIPLLSVLKLHKNAVGDEGAKAFAKSNQRERLRVLGLAAAEVGDEGAHALAESGTLSALVGLELRGNPMSEGAIAELKERFGERVRTNNWSAPPGTPPL